MGHEPSDFPFSRPCVERDGFEPSNQDGTDLQSAAFDRSATFPTIYNYNVNYNKQTRGGLEPPPEGLQSSALPVMLSSHS